MARQLSIVWVVRAQMVTSPRSASGKRAKIAGQNSIIRNKNCNHN